MKPKTIIILTAIAAAAVALWYWRQRAAANGAQSTGINEQNAATPASVTDAGNASLIGASKASPLSAGGLNIANNNLFNLS